MAPDATGHGAAAGRSPRPPLIVGGAQIVRPLMNMLLGHRWAGMEHLPRDRGFILCPNHVTEIDPLVVGHYVYNAGLAPHFLTKAGLFRVPVLGRMLRAGGQIPVERSSAGANSSLDAAARVLERGGCVIIYPEGSLTRDPDLWPMKGRTGAARLALSTGAPVIPLAHWGAQDLLPRYGRGLHIFPRKTVTLLAGPPVDFSAFEGRSLDRFTLAEATNVILNDVAGLLGRLRGEQPPTRRWDPAQHNQTRQGRNFDAGARDTGP